MARARLKPLALPDVAAPLTRKRACRPRTAVLLAMVAVMAVTAQTQGVPWAAAAAASANPDCRRLEPLNPSSAGTALSLEDKLALSPIVVQGRLISRSTSYNGLYLSSIRILRVLKGKVPQRLRRHVRLVFRQGGDGDDRRVRRSRRRRRCEQPVRFDVRSGRKYLMFLERLGAARYAAVARPAAWSKQTKRAAKRVLCKGCASPPGEPQLSAARARLGSTGGGLVVDQGGVLKLKCKAAKSGNPAAALGWEKNGREVSPGFRIRIRTRKRRSSIRVSNVRRSDAGNYSCVAGNVLGAAAKSVSISVRYSAPDPSVTDCPIDSFCLNGGTCLYYEFIGELVCRCRDGFAGQRCQFKKAHIDLPFLESDACGPYGHDIHFREVCAAWKRPPVAEMSRAQYEEWKEVENQLEELRRRKEGEEVRRFRSPPAAGRRRNPPAAARPVLRAMALKAKAPPD